MLCDLLGSAEGLNRCGLKVVHLITGEETREVEWGLGKTMGDEPLAHLADHGQIVVDARDDEVGEFYPYACLFHGEDGIEHRLQMTTTDALVDIVAERLEVDIGSIEVGQEVGKGFLTDITSGDEDIPQSFFMSQTGTVSHIFYIREGLGIGVSDARTVVLQTEVDELLWREAVVIHLVRGDLRDLVVLTVQTTEVTPCAGQRQTGGARVEMIEWFLLDGVDGQRTGFVIDLADEHAIVITTTATATCPIVGNTAMMRTEQTLYHAIV